MKRIAFGIGALSLINVVVMYFLSNTHSGYLVQAAISILAILYASVYERMPRKINIAVMSICLIPVTVAVFLAVYGNTRNVDYTEDVVIVLGAGLHRGEVGGHLVRRLDKAIVYLNRNTNALVIVCGGLGAGQPVTEAEAMKLYLTARGVEPQRIILEDKSTSTYENLSFAEAIPDGYFPGGFHAVLVTNDFHIYRAANVARRVGIDVNPLGASTPWQSLAANYLREVAAVINLWISNARGTT